MRRWFSVHAADYAGIHPRPSTYSASSFQVRKEPCYTSCSPRLMRYVSHFRKRSLLARFCTLAFPKELSLVHLRSFETQAVFHEPSLSKEATMHGIARQHERSSGVADRESSLHADELPATAAPSQLPHTSRVQESLSKSSTPRIKVTPTLPECKMSSSQSFHG